MTAQVDPTLGGRLCRADGGGCDKSILDAANVTRRRLSFAPDLLLLHRPPKRAGAGPAATSAQCRQLQASWRGLEAAYRGGLAKAIGLSNARALRLDLHGTQTSPSCLGQGLRG